MSGKKNESGQSLTEFGLVLPLLLILLLGIMDLGRAFFDYNTISNVAREGARYASAWDHEGASATEIASYAKTLAPATNVTVTVDPSDGSLRKNGKPLTVTVQTSFSPITPLVPGPFTLKSRAVMRSE